jgi:predicted secreted protein
VARRPPGGREVRARAEARGQIRAAAGEVAIEGAEQTAVADGLAARDLRIKACFDRNVQTRASRFTEAYVCSTSQIRAIRRYQTGGSRSKGRSGDRFH